MISFFAKNLINIFNISRKINRLMYSTLLASDHRFLIKYHYHLKISC